MDQVPLDQLSRDDFSSQINTVFRVPAEVSPPPELKLIEVSRVPGPDANKPGSGQPEYEAFSLIFEGPEGAPLPQSTYPLEHEALGRFDLFLVPIGNDRGAYQYQALINRKLH